MAFKIKGSHIIALAMTAGIIGWMYTGEIVIGGQSESGDGVPSIAEREAERSAERFKVNFVTVQPEARSETVMIRGRTQASSVVSVRTQVSGTLIKRHVERGDKVAKGQRVCDIDPGARTAQLAQAEAQLAKAKIDYDGNIKLEKKGFASSAKVKAMKAALDAAKYGVVQMKLQLERSKALATADGIVQDPIAEVGDMLNVGTTCVTLIQTDPIKFVGQVSERDVGKIKTGSTASVKLVGGEVVKGQVTYISPSADAKTRTFLTEINITNTEGTIRDGLTAQALVVLPPISAYRLKPSWITLADGGEIGVRIVGDNSAVKFVGIDLIAQTNSGFWVTGLKPGTKVISLGQENVIDGEIVEAIAQPLTTAEVKN